MKIITRDIFRAYLQLINFLFRIAMLVIMLIVAKAKFFITFPALLCLEIMGYKTSLSLPKRKFPPLKKSQKGKRSSRCKKDNFPF